MAEYKMSIHNDIGKFQYDDDVFMYYNYRKHHATLLCVKPPWNMRKTIRAGVYYFYDVKHHTNGRVTMDRKQMLDNATRYLELRNIDPSMVTFVFT